MAFKRNNFACNPNFPNNWDNSHGLSPPRGFPAPPPLINPSPPFPSYHSVMTPPSIPPPLSIPPPFIVPPPLCNTSVPPPPVIAIPPIAINRPPLQQYCATTDPDEKFNLMKAKLESQFKKVNKTENTPVLMKVSDIKKRIVKCFDFIEQMESLINCLQLTYKSLPESDWLNHCKDANKMKAELSFLINEEILNQDSVKHMKKVVKIRMNKRNYKKRKTKEWQEQKQVAKLNMEQESRRIDLWLEKMKDEVSRAKREEDIKKEADSVLSDVTTKKAEAKRMLNILNSLVKLRTARSRNQSSKVTVSEHENKAFHEVIDRLKKMWLDQFNGYKVEEEGLKVMLGHAEEERAAVEAAQFRKNLKAWLQGIFGPSSSIQLLSIEELIKTRQEWDSFICHDDAPMASKIPIGWVLPCEPSSNDWEKMLT